MKKFLFIFLFFMGQVYYGKVYAQEAEPPKKDSKNETKMEKEEKKKRQLSEKEGKKRHLKIQSKKTRKRMKQSQKKSRRINEPKQEFFLFRLFRRG